MLNGELYAHTSAPPRNGDEMHIRHAIAAALDGGICRLGLLLLLTSSRSRARRIEEASCHEVQVAISFWLIRVFTMPFRLPVFRLIRGYCLIRKSRFFQMPIALRATPTSAAPPSMARSTDISLKWTYDIAKYLSATTVGFFPYFIIAGITRRMPPAREFASGFTMKTFHTARRH